MNLRLFITALFLFFESIMSEKAGLRAAIREEVILEAERKFFPLIMSKISEISIPDQHISIKLSILGNLNIYITNIHLHVNPLPAENIQIALQEPNLVSVIASSISGNGNMDIEFEYFVTEHDRVDIRINRLNIIAQTEISMIESSQEKGKYLPFGRIKNIDLDLDFDFDIHGSIIADIVDLVKGKIKDLIYSELKGALVGAIIDESDKALKQVLDKLPLYINIKDSLAIDYSLVAAPKVTNKYLVLSINGGIVDLSNPDTKSPPFPIPESLPDYVEKGKNGQAFISDYFLLTALRTLYLTERLNLRLKSEDISEESPIKFDTTFLDFILPGIEKLYGSNKKVDLECSADKNRTQPTISLKEKTINGTLLLFCSLEVDNEGFGIVDNYDKALEITIDFGFVVNISIAQEGIISASISNAEFSNSKLISSKVPDLKIINVEKLFDLTLDIGLPIINEKILKNATIPLPTVEGISFKDSTVEVENGYILVNINPHFD